MGGSQPEALPGKGGGKNEDGFSRSRAGRLQWGWLEMWLSRKVCILLIVEDRSLEPTAGSSQLPVIPAPGTSNVPGLHMGA